MSEGKEEKGMTPIEDLKAAQELIEFLDGKINNQYDQLRILALALRVIAGHGLTIERQGCF